MELLDLYDKSLKLTGKTIERGQHIPFGYMIPIVAVLVYNDQGQYLIQKVAASKGNYYASTAGHVQSGETDFTKAMLREMEEEIGLKVSRNDLKLVKIRRYEYKFTFLYLLRSNVRIEDLRLQEEEVESIQWMSIAEIEDLCRQGLFNRTHYELICDCEKNNHFEE
jgi:8-oxo-dGTP diphosphatase